MTESEAIGWEWTGDDVREYEDDGTLRKSMTLTLTPRTSRKVYTCAGCGKRIDKGSGYLDGRDPRAPGMSIRLHSECGL